MAEFTSLINQTAQKYGLAPGLLTALVQKESSFNPRAVSPVGAQGLAQLMPATAKALGVSDPFDPAQNLDGGARYLRDMLKQFDGNTRMALAAYNMGPGYVSRNGVGGGAGYADSILKSWGGAPTANVPVASIAAPKPQAPAQTPAATQTTAQPDMSKAYAIANLVRSNNNLIGIGTPLSVTQAIIDRYTPKPVQQKLEQVGSQVATFQDDTGGAASTNPVANQVISLAKQYLGTKYVWGGASPKTGFDCSGLIQWIYGQHGIKLPRTTYQQIKVGQPVGRDELQPGDAVFFAKDGDVHHEGLYIGNGQFLHSPHTGDVVKISSLSQPYYAEQFAGGRRFSGGGL